MTWIYNASWSGDMSIKKILIGKRKVRVRSDHKGEFIYRHHFLNGRQKLTKVYLIDGVPSDMIDHHAFFLENADDITLYRHGMYEELYQREIERLEDGDDLPF